MTNLPKFIVNYDYSCAGPSSIKDYFQKDAFLGQKAALYQAKFAKNVPEQGLSHLAFKVQK